MFKNLISFKTLLWTTSVILAVCSAAFSVFGLSKLFAGAAISVIIMASTLEFAKLITVTFLHNYYQDIKRGMKSYLLISSAILMIITSLGVYGFLTNAYQLALKTYSENQINTEFIEKNKEFLKKEILNLEKQQQELSGRLGSYDKIRIQQETSALTTKVGNGIQRNIKATSKITEDINKKIDIVSQKKNILTDSLMLLEKKTLNIDLENNQTELGPLIYISRITGYSMDYVVNIFVLIITFVFDPLAIALLLAANFLSKLDKSKTLNQQPETTINETNDEILDQPLENLEMSENISILSADDIADDSDDVNISENGITEIDEKDNVNSDIELTDEDKFYDTDMNTFNKHPWKVGY